MTQRDQSNTTTEQEDRNARALVQLGVTIRHAASEAEDLAKGLKRLDRRVVSLAKRLGVIEDLDAATGAKRS